MKRGKDYKAIRQPNNVLAHPSAHRVAQRQGLKCIPQRPSSLPLPAVTCNKLATGVSGSSKYTEAFLYRLFTLQIHLIFLYSFFLCDSCLPPPYRSLVTSYIIVLPFSQQWVSS